MTMVGHQAPTSPIDLCQNAEAAKGGNLSLAPYADGWVLEPKFDGWRILAHVTEEGVNLYTRTAASQQGKLLEVEAELSQLPVGTWIDGEVVGVSLKDGMVVHEWNAVQKCLGCSDLTKARARAQSLSYVAFDLIAHAGIDARSVAFAKRRELLEAIFAKYEWERVILAPQVDPTDTALEQFIAQGFEGGVCKALSAPYASGQRGAGQVKFKPQENRDFVIMGYKPGESGFEGLVGAIIFGAYQDGKLTEVGRCSGMDMATRIRLTKNEDTYIGAVIEVAHMGKLGTHYRHPQFKRFRSDKPAEQCLA